MDHISIVCFTHFPFICYNDTNFRPVAISHANGFITLSPLTLTSLKAMDVTLKYARFSKFGNVALYQERTILIIHTVHRQQTSCILQQYREVSHLSGILFSFPISLLS